MELIITLQKIPMIYFDAHMADGNVILIYGLISLECIYKLA